VPYQFLGKKQEGGDWEVFLARGELTFVVREGQVVEDAWRIERITPPSMSMTYLPLNQAQTMQIGEAR
jgi:hypothetical protein